MAKDFLVPISIDTVNEQTADAGVTIEGVLIKDSDITLPVAHAIYFGSANNYIHEDVGTLVMYSTSAAEVIGATSFVAAYGVAGGTIEKRIILDGTQMRVQDDQDSVGFVYHDDYSAIGSLNDRWIPDWAAVTGYVADEAYVHPNHSGHITSVADGATTIQPEAIDDQTSANSNELLFALDEILVHDTSASALTKTRITDIAAWMASWSTDIPGIASIVAAGQVAIWANTGAIGSDSGFTWTNGDTLTVEDKIHINDANTVITEDGSGNLSFTDAVTGTKTLAELVSSGGDVSWGTPTNPYVALGDSVSGDISSSSSLKYEYHILELRESTSGCSISLQEDGGSYWGYTHQFSDNTGYFAYGSTVAIAMSTTGAIRFWQYGDGTFTGTAAYALQIDTSGNIIEGPLMSFGTSQYEIPYTNTGLDDFDYSSEFTFDGDYMKVPKIDVGLVTDETERLNVVYGHLNFRTVPAPSTAPTAALAGLGAGNLSNDTYYYYVSFITAAGETGYNNSSESNAITVVDNSTNGQVNLTNIPTAPASYECTGRRIYRTKGSRYIAYGLTVINDNTTTTYTDNTADVDLGDEYWYRKANTTAGKLYIDSQPAFGIGDYFTVFGKGAGTNVLVTTNNTFFGYYTGNNTTSGAANTYIGSEAGRYNITGSGNIGLGSSALDNATDSSNCIAVGASAGASIQSGSVYVTTIGHLSGSVADSGVSYLGGLSGRFNTGSYNVGVGYQCFEGVSGSSNGTYNVGVGAYVGESLTTGSRNTFLGAYSGQLTDTGSYNILLGYNVQLDDPGDNYIFKLGYASVVILEGSSFASSEWIGSAYEARFDTITEYTGSAGVTIESTIYATGLGDDDTEDHIVAIDDSTGLLSKRAVSSLPSGGGDHGALTGLTDDDHTQYALRDLAGVEDDIILHTEETGAIDATAGVMYSVASGHLAAIAISDTTSHTNTVYGAHIVGEDAEVLSQSYDTVTSDGVTMTIGHGTGITFTDNNNNRDFIIGSLLTYGDRFELITGMADGVGFVAGDSFGGTTHSASMSLSETTTNAAAALSVGEQTTNDYARIQLEAATAGDFPITVTDEIESIGMAYTADYSTNGTAQDRWIPDYAAVKAYADSVASGVSFGTVVSQIPYTNSGLSNFDYSTYFNYNGTTLNVANAFSLHKSGGGDVFTITNASGDMATTHGISTGATGASQTWTAGESSSTTGTHDGGAITIAGGNQTGTGGGDGGNVYIKGGSSVSGSVGEVYLGDGSTGALQAQSDETNVVYYDTTTGKLSYGASGAATFPYIVDDASTSTSIEIAEFGRSSSGTPTDGMGGYLSLSVENSNSDQIPLRIHHLLGDTSDTTEDSLFLMQGYNSGSLANFMSITSRWYNANTYGDESIAIGIGAVPAQTGSIVIGHGAGNNSGTTGSYHIGIGHSVMSSTFNIGGYGIAIGFGAEAQDTGAIAIGRYSRASVTNSIMMGYHSSSQTNSVSNSFEVMFGGVRAFKAGTGMGTQMTINADPDTNLTAVENGCIAYDSTDHEFRAYVNSAWTTFGGGSCEWTADTEGITYSSGNVGINAASTEHHSLYVDGYIFNIRTNDSTWTGDGSGLNGYTLSVNGGWTTARVGNYGSLLLRAMSGSSLYNGYTELATVTTSASDHSSRFVLRQRHGTSDYNENFSLDSGGELTLDKYGVGSFSSGTIAYSLGVDSSGNMVEVDPLDITFTKADYTTGSTSTAETAILSDTRVTEAIFEGPADGSTCWRITVNYFWTATGGTTPAGVMRVKLGTTTLVASTSVSSTQCVGTCTFWITPISATQSHVHYSNVYNTSVSDMSAQTVSLVTHGTGTGLYVYFDGANDIDWDIKSVMIEQIGL